MNARERFAEAIAGLSNTRRAEAWAEYNALVGMKQALQQALQLIARSDEFKDGTFVKELQDIAATALAGIERETNNG